MKKEPSLKEIAKNIALGILWIREQQSKMSKDPKDQRVIWSNP